MATKNRGGRPKDPRTIARIERNREKFRDAWFPCPCCDELQPVGIDRRGKPYIGCTDCGMQLFVRLRDGIERMARKRARNEKSDPTVRQRPRTVSDLLKGGGRR